MKRNKLIISLFLIQLFFLNDSFAQINSKSQLPINLQNGLVAFYPFNGNAGDSSGNGNNGTANNITYGIDRFGRSNSSGVFAKSNSSYYFYPASAQFQPNSFTQSVWFKTNIIQTGVLGSEKDQWIAGYSPNTWASGPSYSAFLDVTNNSILTSRCWTRATSWQDISTSQNTIVSNIWYNAITTYDNSTGTHKFYLNGILIGERTTTLEFFNQSGFYIGASRQNLSGSIGTFFDGQIDDVMFYNRPLSSIEITQLYTGNFCPVGQGITINPLQDTTRVCGTSTQLNAGSGFASYSWNTSATTQSISPTQSGFYKVTVTNSNGCSASDSTYLSLVKAKIIQRDTTICKGASITLNIDSTIIGSSYSVLPSNLRNGMVAYYPFNGNANDESGNGNNGTITSGSVPFIADRNGKVSSAIQLGGGYIVTTPSVFTFQQNQAFTVSIWFTLETNSSGGRLLSNECPEGNFRIGTGVNGNYAVQYGDYIYDNAPLNTWTHLVYTFDNKSEKVYINGSLKYTNTEGVILFFNHCNALTIGAKAASAFDRWVGKADELIVYNRALSDAEVFQLNNNQSVTWSNGATNNSISVSPTQTTKYYVTVSDGITSCQDSVTVTVNDPAGFNPLSDTTRVCGFVQMLDAGEGFAAYSWNTGATTQSISPTSSGSYKVTVTKSTGCTSSDSTLILFNRGNISSRDTAICGGQFVTLEAQRNIGSLKYIGTYTDHDYYIDTIPRKWTHARDYASSQGMMLWKIDDLAENLAVYNFLPYNADNNAAYWTGLYQDRTSADYSEPSGGGSGLMAQT